MDDKTPRAAVVRIHEEGRWLPVDVQSVAGSDLATAKPGTSFEIPLGPNEYIADIQVVNSGATRRPKTPKSKAQELVRTAGFETPPDEREAESLYMISATLVTMPPTTMVTSVPVGQTALLSTDAVRRAIDE